MTVYYFAYVDGQDKVKVVHLVAEENALDENGDLDENKAAAHLDSQFKQELLDLYGIGEWIRCCPEGSIRYHYPLDDYLYIEDLDAFVSPCPGPEYILWDNMTWHNINDTYTASVDVADLESLDLDSLLSDE